MTPPMSSASEGAPSSTTKVIARSIVTVTLITSPALSVLFWLPTDELIATERTQGASTMSVTCKPTPTAVDQLPAASTACTP